MNERYNKNSILLTNDVYKPLADQRGMDYIKHYEMSGLNAISQKDMKDMNIIPELWIKGSTLWKFAAKYYDKRASLWWVIAHFNQKPTDQHFQIGDTVYIPLPLDKVLRSMGL